MAKKVGRPNQGKPGSADYIAIRVLKTDVPFLKVAAASTGRTMSEMFGLLVRDYVENKMESDAANHMKSIKERFKGK